MTNSNSVSVPLCDSFVPSVVKFVVFSRGEMGRNFARQLYFPLNQ